MPHSSHFSDEKIEVYRTRKWARGEWCITSRMPTHGWVHLSIPPPGGWGLWNHKLFLAGMLTLSGKGFKSAVTLKLWWQDLYWLKATGYRFKGWVIGPISQWGWVVRPHSRRVCEMGDFGGFFRKHSPMLFQSRKFSTILGISGNYLMHSSPPLLPLGTPTIQMFDHLYWCSNFLFNFLISSSFYLTILKFLYFSVLATYS